MANTHQSAQARYEDLMAYAEKKYGLKVVAKDEHYKWLWNFIHYFLCIVSFGQMTNFKSGFHTTIGNIVGFREGWRPGRNYVNDYHVLRHELKHVRQWWYCGGRINFVLGVAVMGILYVFVPLPVGLALFRYLFERSAYLESLKAERELGIQITMRRIDSIVGHFTGPSYLWTWPFPGAVRGWFMKKIRLEMPDVYDDLLT